MAKGKKSAQVEQTEQTKSTQANSFNMLQKTKDTSKQGMQAEQTNKRLSMDTIDLMDSLGEAFDELKNCISDKFKKVSIGEEENFRDYWDEREVDFSKLNNHKKNDVKRDSDSIDKIVKDVTPVVTGASHMIEMFYHTNALKTFSSDKESAQKVSTVLKKMDNDIDSFIDKHAGSGIGSKLTELFKPLLTALEKAINQISQYLSARPGPK